VRSVRLLGCAGDELMLTGRNVRAERRSLPSAWSINWSTAPANWKAARRDHPQARPAAAPRAA
jgi:hypothetical protein